MAKKIGFIWSNPVEKVTLDMSRHVEETTRRIVREELQHATPQAESHMKQNAPWQDRTGNARQSLHAEFEDFNKSPNQSLASIVLSYGAAITYAPYLEYGWQGRYSIIQPTLAAYTTLIMGRIRSKINE